MRVLEVFGLTFIFFTNPTTTADEVPPNAEPTNKHESMGKSNMTLHKMVIVIHVTKKPIVVIPAESLKDSLTSDNFKSVPLSNNIKMRR